MTFKTKMLVVTATLLLTGELWAQETKMVLIKPKTVMMDDQSMAVSVNGVTVGEMPSNSYMELAIYPGSYNVESARPFRSNPTAIDVAEGQTVYVQFYATPNPSGQDQVNTSITLPTADQGMQSIASYTAVMPLTTDIPSQADAPAASVTDGLNQNSPGANPFLDSLGSLDVNEVIANSERQRNLEEIGDLYSFEAKYYGDASEGGGITSTYSAVTDEEPPKLDKQFPDLKYRRSSLYTLMVNDQSRPAYPYILQAFGNAEMPEKYNDHNVGLYLVEGEGGLKDEALQTEKITTWLAQKQVAKMLVAKWFNRSPEGGFSMDLIAKRGYYDASALDVKLAEQSARGKALLADAGEELIKNTFVIVNDYHFTDKEEVAKKVNKGLGLLSAVADAAGYGDVADIATGVATVADFVGKGYVVKTRSYLYQLDWTEEAAAMFYTRYWTTDDALDNTRVERFNESDIFQLKFVGYQAATADLFSTKATTKTNDELIQMATLKATDKAMAKLSRTYEAFRTKTPLFTTEPELTAKIGLKEGIEKGDKFEVLEQVIDSEGLTEYKRKGTIQVDHKRIWDNTFGADEEVGTQEIDATYFKDKAKGSYYPGMLIRQIK